MLHARFQPLILQRRILELHLVDLPIFVEFNLKANRMTGGLEVISPSAAAANPPRKSHIGKLYDVESREQLVFIEPRPPSHDFQMLAYNFQKLARGSPVFVRDSQMLVRVVPVLVRDSQMLVRMVPVFVHDSQMLVHEVPVFVHEVPVFVRVVPVFVHDSQMLVRVVPVFVRDSQMLAHDLPVLDHPFQKLDHPSHMSDFDA